MSPPVLRSISDSPLICKGAHYLTSRVSPYGSRATRRVDRRVRHRPLTRSASDYGAFQVDHPSPDYIWRLPQTSAANRFEASQCPSRLRVGRDKGLDQAACRDSRQEQQPPTLVDSHANWRYGSSVAVNPAADLGRSSINRRTSAKQYTGAFLLPAFYGSCARDTFGCAGFLFARSANPRIAVTITRLAANGGSSQIGASTMKHTLNPPSSHAAAWKARALAALRADSSLSVRLARYNSAMARARALEAQEVRLA